MRKFEIGDYVQMLSTGRGLLTDKVKKKWESKYPSFKSTNMSTKGSKGHIVANEGNFYLIEFDVDHYGARTQFYKINSEKRFILLEPSRKTINLEIL